MSKRSLLLIAALALPGLSGAVLAASRTVTLSVPGMNCPVCPFTVKKALQRVEGVERVAVAYEPKEAVVTFDDTRTNVEELREATEEVGYPSLLKAGQ